MAEIDDLLIRCKIAGARWRVQEKQIKQGQVFNMDTAALETFGDFASKLWEALGGTSDEFGDKIESKGWGVDEILSYLEQKVSERGRTPQENT